jgi:hypothetical protein
MVGQSADDLILAAGPTGDDLDDRIDRDAVFLHPAENFSHSAQSVPVEQHGSTIAAAGMFETFRQSQFLGAGEQRNGAHLFQIEAQGIVRPAGKRRGSGFLRGMPRCLSVVCDREVGAAVPACERTTIGRLQQRRILLAIEHDAITHWENTRSDEGRSG